MRTCENCQSPDLFQVDVTIAAGPTRFAHCRRCEHRWWSDSAGARVAPLQAVHA